MPSASSKSSAENVTVFFATPFFSIVTLFCITESPGERSDACAEIEKQSISEAKIAEINSFFIIKYPFLANFLPLFKDIVSF
jgi:hypothetical protein